jgi:hypothetical protein
MKKETTKKGNRLISTYQLKITQAELKDVLDDVRKEYANKNVTIQVQ